MSPTTRLYEALMNSRLGLPMIEWVNIRSSVFYRWRGSLFCPHICLIDGTYICLANFFIRLVFEWNTVFKFSIFFYYIDDISCYVVVCLSVCLCVCLFTFKFAFKHLFAPTSQSLMSKIFKDSGSLGKSNGLVSVFLTTFIWPFCPHFLKSNVQTF